MSLTTPVTKESLEQALYQITARSGIQLDPAALQPTLLHAQAETGAAAVVLHLLIDATSPEAMKASAAHVRAIAESIERAADTK